MAESFWAVPDAAALRTPLGILREQASALTAQTKGMLVGVVETSIATGIEAAGRKHDWSARSLEAFEIARNAEIVLKLEISVPALNDYRYRILSYAQPIELYPGVFLDYNETVSDEAEFVNAIREILSSNRVKNVLTSLLAQVREA
jgi:hypothetical protein